MFGVIIFFILYFLPTLIAHSRKHPNENAIGVFNFFLGWTILGWILALVWSQTTKGDDHDCCGSY